MSFENLNIENINYCPEIDYNSGLRTRLFYAPESFFVKTPLPSPEVSLASEVIIQEEILMKSDKKLCYIDILIDENELRLLLSGSGKRSKINLSVYILGFLPSVLGFINRAKNVPLVFFIEDANGNNWQIGHSRNRAFIESAETVTGKRYEDNSGAAVSITCNSPLYLYNNSLDEFSRLGDFNNDFSDDFDI